MSGPRPGLVVASHGRHLLVESPDGARLLCHLRGKKNLCVVGDRVQWQPAGDEAVIERIEPRRNLLHRQDDWRSKSFAANIDQLLVLVAVQPSYSESQLARALIAAAAAGIEARIVLNKTDLPEADAAHARLAPYRAMGVAVLETSLKHQRESALHDLAPLLHRRSTLVLGPSGMGKSTLINLLVPTAQAQVGEISLALASGRHTTTASTWYWIDEARSAALIDSPGFQEFGLRHLKPEQLAALMPDIGAQAQACRFYNCTHLHEPGCGVRAALHEGIIAPARYRIYEQLHAELAAPALRR